MPACAKCGGSHPTSRDVRLCHVGGSEKPRMTDASAIHDAFRNTDLGQSAPAPRRTATATAKPATERQLAFLERLLVERPTYRDVENLWPDVIAKFSAQQASQAIDAAMKVEPEVASTLTSTAAWHDLVPEGRYALPTQEDGHLAFYQVDHGKGTWLGRVFVSQLIGSPGHYREQRLSLPVTLSTLKRLAEDVVGAAAAYGKATRTCGQCGSELSHVRSRAAGYGQTCAANRGWRYPTQEEALALLGEGE